jgi:hypothetical protein
VEILIYAIYYKEVYHGGYLNLSNTLSSFFLIILSLIVVGKNKILIKKFDISQISILLSIVFWFLGEVIYGYNYSVLKIDPFPSLSDMFYLMGFILLFYYFYNINKVYKLETGIIISSIITLSFLVVYFLYLSIFVFNFYSVEGNDLEIFIIFIYPIFDAYIIIISILYYFQEKKITLTREFVSWIFILAFGICFIIGDSLYGYYTLFYSRDNIHWMDLFFNLAYTMLGIGILVRLKYYFNQIEKKQFFKFD